MSRASWIATAFGTLLVSGTVSADVTAFDVGGEHACAVDGCQETACWGYNGQHDELVGVSGDFIDIAVGTDHNCGLEDSGAVTCWGRSDNDRLEPPHDDFIDIEAGGAFSCGIRAGSEEIVCWGRRGTWEGDEGESEPSNWGATDGPPLGVHYREMSLGYDYGCAITTGRSVLHCWGESVPDGVRELWFDEVMVDPNEKFATVSAGFRHLCFTSTRERVYCLGDNAANQLMPDYASSSTQKWPGENVGEWHTALGLEKSTVLGIPWNMFHAVTWGSTGTGVYVEDVSAGILGTCAVYRNGGSSNRDIYCWGYPFQYGYGRAPFGGGYEEVHLGGHQFCAEDHDGGGHISCRWESPAYENPDTHPDAQQPDLSCG